MRKQFRAPWDLLLIVVTTGISVFLIWLYYIIPGLFQTVITWGIILGCAAYGIYGYSIQDGKLLVLRLGWAKGIPFSEIIDVEVKPNAMMGSIRTWGIGGMFGYIGYFNNRILKSYKAYATHRRKTVVVSTKDHLIVVTPDDPEEFVASLKESIREQDDLSPSL